MNINDPVWIRLTPTGRRIVAADAYPAPYSEDSGGWSKWQLWVLMQVFGPHIHMGMREAPFHTEIRLEAPPGSTVDQREAAGVSFAEAWTGPKLTEAERRAKAQHDDVVDRCVDALRRPDPVVVRTPFADHVYFYPPAAHPRMARLAEAIRRRLCIACGIRTSDDDHNCP